MNIEFIKIEIQNFKSIGHLIELNYQNLKGLNFIFGKNLDVQNAKNGAGKSVAFIDALVFALFGKTLKNTNNKYIPNRSMPPTLKPYAKVYFRSNGQLYSCETYGKISGKIMGTVGMELLKLNDDYSVAEDLTQSSIVKTRQYVVNNLLGCSFNVFKSSVVMTSADFTNFYEGMTKEQKRKYIESIFNLDCFGEMFIMLKKNINSIKKESSMIKTSIISSSQKVDSIKEKSKNYEAEKLNKQNELKGQIIEKVGEIKAIKKEYDDMVMPDLENLYKEKADISSSLKIEADLQIDNDKKIIRIDSELKSIYAMKKKMKELTDGLCKDCTALMNRRYNFNEDGEKIVKLEACLNELKEKKKAHAERYDELAKTLENKIIAIKDIEEIKVEKEKLLFKINSYKNDLINLKSRFDELKNSNENPFVGILTEMQEEIKNDAKRLSEYVKNYKHLDVLKEACSENGIKKYIIKDIVKLLNSLIQKYLNEIGCEFIVYFDETFDFRFITTTGECEFSSFSAGEKQRIQIATLFAFRDLIINGKISSNIFIIDELLDANVDNTCIENVMGILKRKSQETNQNIFMISHRSELADNLSFWNNIIKVTKENQQSKYEII